MKRVVGALLTVALMASSVRADVIPSRRTDEGSQEARRQVSERLQVMGMKQDRATAHSNDLSDHEARYFADSPDRIQMAGDDSGFPVIAAMIEGVVMLGLMAGGMVWRYNVNN